MSTRTCQKLSWLADFLEWKKQQQFSRDPRSIAKLFRLSKDAAGALGDFAKLLKKSENDIVHEAIALYSFFHIQAAEEFLGYRKSRGKLR